MTMIIKLCILIKGFQMMLMKIVFVLLMTYMMKSLPSARFVIKCREEYQIRNAVYIE